jgi:hypothetical protein
MSATRDDRAKRITITMVEMKIIRSIPRRVCAGALRFSPPPNALPKSASDCCRRTRIINSAERVIWIYGNIGIMMLMGNTIS